MIRSIKGVKDILPDEIGRWQHIEQTARRLAQVSGFREIRVPIFESTELFARSIGASTDIVEKEMYTFPDRDGKSLTLRPEGTAGVVRAYVEHNLNQVSPAQKFFYLGPMFRHERPQAGRLRQFHQFGIEAFGSAHPLADLEVVALLWQFLSELALPGLTLEMNSIGDRADREVYKSALVGFLSERVARLCENCRRRMETNPLRVLDCKTPDCRAVTEDAPRITEALSPASKEHFTTVLSGLKDLGIPFSVNPRLVRGLDYYTLTTFEVTTHHLGAQNAVGAGGRYDGLVQTLGGPQTPAVGFAVGLERVSLMIPDSQIPPPPGIVAIAAFGDAGMPAGVRLLYALRARGLRADLDTRATSLKGHLRQADRWAAPFVAILGDDEVAQGRVIIRNMATKQQEAVPIGEAPGRLAQLTGAAFSS